MCVWCLEGARVSRLRVICCCTFWVFHASLSHLTSHLPTSPPSLLYRSLALLSYDVRERDYVKTITHRIYGKLTNRRAQIRRMACDIFYRHSHEKSDHNGIAEVLQILGSIINGFAVPVKDNHRDMLKQALIPLHRLDDVLDYHVELKYCMLQYIMKETTFAEVIFDGMLKYVAQLSRNLCICTALLGGVKVNSFHDPCSISVLTLVMFL